MAANAAPFGFYPVEQGEPMSRLRAKASAVFARGDLVILTSDEADIAVATSATLAGVAAETKTIAASGIDYLMVFARPGARFYGRADGTLASVGQGDTFGQIGATGAMMANIADAQNTDTLRLERKDVELADDQTAAGTVIEVSIPFAKHAFGN